eukprot:m.237651 g.237651  ORF g.237651 m.237651 type:complete len:259 (+) comp15277_c0_seq2:1511-2287(+)
MATQVQLKKFSSRVQSKGYGMLVRELSTLNPIVKQVQRLPTTYVHVMCEMTRRSAFKACYKSWAEKMVAVLNALISKEYELRSIFNTTVPPSWSWALALRQQLPERVSAAPLLQSVDPELPYASQDVLLTSMEKLQEHAAPVQRPELQQLDADIAVVQGTIQRTCTELQDLAQQLMGTRQEGLSQFGESDAIQRLEERISELQQEILVLNVEAHVSQVTLIICHPCVPIVSVVCCECQTESTICMSNQDELDSHKDRD